MAGRRRSTQTEVRQRGGDGAEHDRARYQDSEHKRRKMASGCRSTCYQTVGQQRIECALQVSNNGHSDTPDAQVCTFFFFFFSSYETICSALSHVCHQVMCSYRYRPVLSIVSSFVDKEHMYCPSLNLVGEGAGEGGKRRSASPRGTRKNPTHESIPYPLSPPYEPLFPIPHPL